MKSGEADKNRYSVETTVPHSLVVIILWPFSFKTAISLFLAWGFTSIPLRVANVSNRSLCINVESD